jgi:tol-pal system protein YbgF
MRKFLLVALTGIAMAVTTQGAFAQQDVDNDLGALMDRVGRLEQSMSNMQRQIERRRADGGPSAIGGDAADQLSDQMRDLTGRVEEVRHDVDVLKTRMDKMSSDIDLRLQVLEHPGGAPTAMSDQQPERPPALTPPSRERNPPPPRETMAAPPPRESQTAMATSPGAADAGVLPSGSPQHQYDYAFGLLRDANYPAAERALRDFIRKYPNNKLSSNAQYWLGETYFVRRDFKAAAATFAEGYQQYPKGAKAGPGLLKLGISLSMLNRKADACRAFAQLDRDFPIVAADIKQKEADEKHRAGCR